MSKVFPDEDKKNLLMTLLKVLGGRKVEVHFDGSGDSGSIDYVGLMDQEGNEINLKNATLDWHDTNSEFDPATNKWKAVTKLVPNMPVDEILQKITEDALEESGHDWYNNEGGYGRLNIDLTTTPPEITLSVSIRYTSTEDFEIDLNEEDEEETNSESRG